jgi:hypothetical protein
MADLYTLVGSFPQPPDGSLFAVELSCVTSPGEENGLLVDHIELAPECV